MCSSSTETRSIVKHRSTLRKLASLLKLLNLLSNPDSYRTNAQIHVASHPLLRLSHSRLSHPVPWLVLSHTFEDFPLGSRSLCASERNPSLFLLSCGSFQPLVQRFNKDSSTDQTCHPRTKPHPVLGAGAYPAPKPSTPSGFATHQFISCSSIIGLGYLTTVLRNGMLFLIV